jgi:ATP-dependent DNA helicase RecG
MKPAEKQAAMEAFKRGSTGLLVATTVIEVGVDVPNASLMVIENAERLGLAQLHQLRGRVGRGAAASTCVLLYRPPLSADGAAAAGHPARDQRRFRHAEKDLELRGPGELLGTRQTGLAGFRIADLMRDAACCRRCTPWPNGCCANIRKWPIGWWHAGSAARHAARCLRGAGLCETRASEEK